MNNELNIYLFCNIFIFIKRRNCLTLHVLKRCIKLLLQKIDKYLSIAIFKIFIYINKVNHFNVIRRLKL